jgi:Putative Ig domain/Fibronectin type III domain
MNRLGRVAIAALLMLSALWTGDVAQADELAAPAFTLSKSRENVIEDVAMVGYTISSTGGAIASYSISPAAPAGTTFDTSTGLLSGTPTTPGVMRGYLITATNTTSTASQTFTLAVLYATPGVPSKPTATQVSDRSKAVVTVAAGTGGTPTSYLVSASPTVEGATRRCKVVVPKTTCIVKGLTYLTSYTFTATATNVKGTSSASIASTSVLID